VESFGATDIGPGHQVNGDSLFCDDELGIYVVADGMGGQPARSLRDWRLTSSSPSFAAAVNTKSLHVSTASIWTFYTRWESVTERCHAGEQVRLERV
jgi:serine/threonine protein phosphatase PrpC